MYEIARGHRAKGAGAILLAKLLAIVAAVILFWGLQLKFAIGATASVALHLVLVAVLAIYALRTGLFRRRRG